MLVQAYLLQRFVKTLGKKMLGQDDFFVVILSVIIIIIICGKEEHFIDSQIDKFFFFWRIKMVSDIKKYI